MLKRLRLKFICITMLIVTVMLCVIFGLVYHFTRQNLQQESLRTMETIGNSSLLSLGLPNELTEEVRLPYFVLQLGLNGEIIATGGGYYDLSDREFLDEILQVVFFNDDQCGVLSEYDLRFYRVQTLTGQRVVFADMSSERSVLRSLVGTCAVIGAVSLCVFLAVSLLLANWAVKPVEEAWDQQRQFVDDASHELKTPLTVILTNAELLREPDCGEAARAQFSESILTMANQMRGLVESLLELARADSGRVRFEMAPLDLSELTENVSLPFEPLCYERGLACGSDIEPGVTVRGSEPRLRQAAEILLDNAIKYASPGGSIFLRLRRTRGRCLLSVENTGEEISPEDLKNIFKRFYRVDKVRSMSHSYGLGLSIAESIVNEHKGRIWAESRDGVNTFFIELPLA